MILKTTCLITFEHVLLIVFDIGSLLDGGIGNTLTAESMKLGSVSIALESELTSLSDPAIILRRS